MKVKKVHHIPLLGCHSVKGTGANLIFPIPSRSNTISHYQVLQCGFKFHYLSLCVSGDKIRFPGLMMVLFLSVLIAQLLVSQVCSNIFGDTASDEDNIFQKTPEEDPTEIQYPFISATPTLPTPSPASAATTTTGTTRPTPTFTTKFCPPQIPCSCPTPYLPPCATTESIDVPTGMRGRAGKLYEGRTATHASSTTR